MGGTRGGIRLRKKNFGGSGNGIKGEIHITVLGEYEAGFTYNYGGMLTEIDV
jgi:hypothetical protein